MANAVKVKPSTVYTRDGSGPIGSDQLLNYTCPLCDHILCDPMQGECGDRFCKSCLNERSMDE